MPTNNELRSIQKRTLHELISVKRELDGKRVRSVELERYLNTTIAEMDAEDVAYVEKIANNRIERPE